MPGYFFPRNLAIRVTSHAFKVKHTQQRIFFSESRVRDVSQRRSFRVFGFQGSLLVPQKIGLLLMCCAKHTVRMHSYTEV